MRPGKEDLVLQDDMDLRMVEALKRQPARLGPVAAARAAIRETFGSYTEADLDLMKQNIGLSRTVPEVRGRALDELARTTAVMAGALAERTGRPADDLVIRTVAGAILGVIMAITLPGDGWSDREDIREMFGRIDQALGLLEAGLPL